VTSQAANSIILNASGFAISPATFGLFASPIRALATNNTYVMTWNVLTSEIQYSSTGTKTFVIDHPVNVDKYLVHACLEGPEAGVYYRGEAKVPFATDRVNVFLPSYVKDFASECTVSVTPIGKPRLFGSSKVSSEGTFYIYGPPGEYHWVVYGKRGSIDVEPLKKDTNVSGDGPYKWITSSSRR
jgi:hypothetical protein